MYLKMENSINFTLHLFTEIGIIQLEWERKLEKVKKKTQGKGLLLGKKQPVQRNSDSGRHFINKALSNFDLEGWTDKLGIKHFRSIYSRDALPDKIYKNECGFNNQSG